MKTLSTITIDEKDDGLDLFEFINPYQGYIKLKRFNFVYDKI